MNTCKIKKLDLKLKNCLNTFGRDVRACNVFYTYEI